MRGRKKERGRGRGGKNTPARYHCSFGKRTLANGAPDWCGIGKKIDACQLTVYIVYSVSVHGLLELERLGMSRE